MARFMSHRFRELLKHDRRRPLVVAHRGASAHAPENTLEAAILGWEAGADAWELDVQLTRDGVPVVLHDETLIRTSNAAVRFAADPRSRNGFRLVDLELDEVRTLDAGSWLMADFGGARSARAFGTLEVMPESRQARYRSGQVRIPTLSEALNLTRDLDWLVNIELKSFPDQPEGLMEAVLEIIEETGTADRVLLSSFDHQELARIPSLVETRSRELREMPWGVLVWTPQERIDRYVKEIVRGDTAHLAAETLGSASVGYQHRPSASSLKMKDVDALRASGIPILVYTVNDARPGGLADHLMALGIDGLFTDDPLAIRARFASGSELSVS